MLLKTPFEIVNGPNNSYLVSHFSIHRVSKIEEDLRGENFALLSRTYEKIIDAKTDVNIVIVDPPERIRGFLEGFVSVYSPHFEWPEAREGRIIVDVLIFAEGVPKKLDTRDSKRPAIVYNFDALYRYRSCINWKHSGRPCPICVLKIFQIGDSESVNLIRSALSLSKRKESGLTTGVDRLSDLNIIKTVCDAITLANAIKEKDPAVLDSLRYAERLDVTNNMQKQELLPTDPQCDHRGFYG
ncbi:hypothetical protein QS713_02185 [Gleimia hominis]|uniref:Uncharacterized protein n=1 Tax=Gleimia hominis TaxID=595468 RepID=A0ABU3I929_9ACTO|nr:hypothetical protein [Gleimia hominis]MDT3766873.1 hypothetical protein [Gleimia hominis]